MIAKWTIQWGLYMRPSLCHNHTAILAESALRSTCIAGWYIVVGYGVVEVIVGCDVNKGILSLVAFANLSLSRYCT